MLSHLPDCPRHGIDPRPDACTCPRVQVARDRLRLVSAGGVGLATATLREGRSWYLSIWVRDADGRPVGQVNGEKLPSREAARARLEELRPELGAAHEHHRRVAAALGRLVDMLTAGKPDHGRFRVDESDVTVAAGGFVRLLALAASGSTEVEQLLADAAARATDATTHLECRTAARAVAWARTAGSPETGREPCADLCPPAFTGRWRDWHRGHGCDKDDGLPRTAEGQAEIDAILGSPDQGGGAA